MRHGCSWSPRALTRTRCTRSTAAARIEAAPAPGDQDRRIGGHPAAPRHLRSRTQAPQEQPGRNQELGRRSLARIEPRNLNRSWDARCAKAEVRKITIHDARRTCGSLLADLDVHPRVAMAILRHAQVSITMGIYTMVLFQADPRGAQ